MNSRADLVAAAAAEVDLRFPDHVRLLQDLVRRPSTLGDVRAAQDLVYQHLHQIGLEAHMEPRSPYKEPKRTKS